MKRSFYDIIRILDGREKRSLALQVVADVCISILDIAFLALLLFLVNFYSRPDAHREGLINGVFLVNHPFLVMGVFCVAYALKNWIAYIALKKQSHFVYAVAARLSEKRLKHYLGSDYETYVHVDSSVYIRKISHQPIEFAQYILRGFQQVVGQSLLVLISIAAILYYDARLFVLLFLVLLIPLVITGWLLKKKLAIAKAHTRDSGEKSLQHLREALSGFVESKIFFKKDFFTSRYIKFQKELNGFLASQQVIQTMPSRLMEVFAVAGLFFLFVINSMLSGQQVSVVTIGAFMAASYKIIPGIVKILNGAGQVKTYDYFVRELLEEAAGEKQETPATRMTIDSIELKDLAFSYQDKTVFENLNLQIKKGELLGISGFSGKGKTTLINLLLGFLSPQKGSILVNGKPIHAEGKNSVWQRISYVKQQPFFIHDSAFKNVVLDDDDYDENRFNRMAELTGFNKFINGSLHAVIRENGKNISGGQRQRIALTRALYKDFDLLILDEPFSEIDEKSEKEIIEQLKIIAAEGKMIILITHNHSSLQYCNKLVQMDHAW